MHDHHQVRRCLSHRNAQPAHIFGQSRLRYRHAVLHQHLRLIDIRARLEDDVDRQPPVTRRFRLDVEHIVDAIDLLLDRRRHRFGNDRSRRARVGRGDVDGRRRDLGIFRNGQRPLRDQADNRDEQ